MVNIVWSIRIRLIRLFLIARALLQNPRKSYCPICHARTFFYEEGPWLREKLRCMRCGSIPRWRGLFSVLETQVPDWRNMAIHESSPYGAVSKKLAGGCSRYTPTNYYPGVEPGTFKNGIRSENLERQTFSDRSFDVVITQDVLEHVSDPKAVFKEIGRTLKKGGKHIFTMPRNTHQPTEPRVTCTNGQIVHLKDPEYHGNPIDNKGSLVITDWGSDTCELILEWTGMKTEVIHYRDESTPAEDVIEIFVSHSNN